MNNSLSGGYRFVRFTRILVICLSFIVTLQLCFQGVAALDPSTLPGTLQNGLVSYWDMTNAAGQIIDQVGSHDGTITGADCTGAGYRGVGIGCAFNGNDFISANSLTADIDYQNFTLIGWVNSIEPGATQSRYALAFHTSVFGNRMLLGQNAGDDRMQLFDSGAGWVASDQNIVNTGWHMVGIVSDFTTFPKKMTFHFDNIYQNQHDTGFFVDPTDLFTLGMDYDPGPVMGEYWQGDIDEVAVWDRTLSSAEIDLLYAFYLCHDGAMSGDETGTDCGGSACAACPQSASGFDYSIAVLVLSVIFAAAVPLLAVGKR